MLVGKSRELIDVVSQGSETDQWIGEALVGDVNVHTSNGNHRAVGRTFDFRSIQNMPDNTVRPDNAEFVGKVRGMLEKRGGFRLNPQAVFWMQ